MPSTNLQADNHFVPQLYVKRFESASDSSRVWRYRILVSSTKVPEWKESPIKGVAYHRHLYTRVLAGGTLSDEMEKWLNLEFEAPAASALEKISSDARLSPDDWRTLIRFAFAQDVRTPARLMHNQERWDKEIPPLLDSTLKDSIEKIKQLKESGQQLERRPLETSNTQLGNNIPMRVIREFSPGAESGRLGIEVLAGRGLWLYSIRHTLTHTIKRLSEHRWTILVPPRGLTWFTSDDPLIRLNYYGPQNYDFEGGWGKKGTEVFMPLDPQHLLYTKIGSPVPKRGTVLSHAEAAVFRKVIAEHAFRMIYSAIQDADVSKLRPRLVDANLVKHEEEQWKNWHENQTKREQEFMSTTQKANPAEPSK